MKRYEDYNIDEVQTKRLIASLEKSTIIEHAIIGFIIGVCVILLLYFVDSMTFDCALILACVIAGLICSGVPCVFRKLEFIGGILFLPIRLMISLIIGIPVTAMCLLWNISKLRKYQPIIEEDMKRHQENYSQSE